jgi:hypothetical protein
MSSRAKACCEIVSSKKFSSPDNRHPCLGEVDTNLGSELRPGLASETFSLELRAAYGFRDASEDVAILTAEDAS